MPPVGNKSWLDDGFRHWKSNRKFLFKWDDEDFQGDRRLSLTVVLFGHAFQYTVWVT